MQGNVGVNVIEVDGRASPAIQPAPTSVAAFLGILERGRPNSTVRVSDFQQFVDRFGGYRSDSFTAYALAGFFANGGREAQVVRVVGAGSTAASVVLQNRETPDAASLRVTAGYRGAADPGPWGDRLRLEVRDDPRLRTELGASTAVNATSAALASVRGLRVGSVLRFEDGGSVFFRRVTALAVDTGTVSFSDPIAPVLAQASTRVSSAEFRLIVRYRASPASELTVVEQWGGLSLESDSPDYAVRRVNHETTGSRFIVLEDLSGAAESGLENPEVVTNVALAGGVENTPGAPDFIGNAAARSGLCAFDTAAVQLLAIPDVHRLVPNARAAIVRAALDYAAHRGDCMYIGAAPDRGAPPSVVPRAPSDYTELESHYVASIQAYSEPFQASKVFGALYAPFVLVSDPIGPGPAPVRFVPPDGHVMGVYARTELERGVFKAPAGPSALVRGVLGTSSTFTDAEHTALVRSGLVNGIRPSPGQGITIDASRTLSTDTRWWFVNVRLLFNFVKASLRDGLRFVRQEPHTEELRRAVRFNVVRPFLLGLWRQGAFGSGTPDESFVVKCDAENNAPAEVNLGNFRVDVLFYPARPAETILIVVGQQDSGAAAEEG
ncbi:MAG TPA: hypothetical protein VIM73_06475 [Polyangiaceae bacterium]